MLRTTDLTESRLYSDAGKNGSARGTLLGYLVLIHGSLLFGQSLLPQGFVDVSVSGVVEAIITGCCSKRSTGGRQGGHSRLYIRSIAAWIMIGHRTGGTAGKIGRVSTGQPWISQRRAGREAIFNVDDECGRERRSEKER